MQILLSTQPPDRQNHKCLVLGFFKDEKPPRGICGLVDWRLNSLISKEIKKGHIRGDFREQVAIPRPERINAEMLFLFGLGPLADLSYDRIYDAARQMMTAAGRMKLWEFAFDLPGNGRSALSPAIVLEAMLTGFFDSLSEDIARLTHTKVCLVASPANLKEIADGLKRFNEHVKHMGSVDFSELEAHLAPL
ncbi:MAG TPA: hypothetical protein P5238_06435 [Smithellaceae bacterium]|nr:hypothetical protein [Smithellaceae bacterium]HRS83101.1 hypothetical protein [Smithellaceae bacterium]HRV45339.1 hypothetical protein [Smithellaceae bacterium]